MTHNRSSGRHRHRMERVTVAGTIPVVIALTLGGVAQAEPDAQPGVSVEQAQPGVSGEQSQPGVSTPAPAPQREYLAGYQPSPEVAASLGRSYEDFQNGNQYVEAPIYTEPMYPQAYYEPAPNQEQYYGNPGAQWTEPPPAPEAAPAAPPVPMVKRKVIAPVDAPEGYLFTGAGLIQQPPWMLDADRDRITNTIAAVQADAGNALINAGVDAPQADRVTGGAIGGGLLGAGIGLTALGGPAAVVGAGGGALIGAGIGAAVTAPTGGWGVGPGAAIGAGVGAAVIGLPAAAVGAGVGGAAGALVGATVFGGQDLTIEEPAPAPSAPAVEAVPAAPAPLWTPPVIDTSAVTAQTVAVVEQVEQFPAGAEVVEQARDFTETAPAYVEQAAPQVNATLTQVRGAALAQQGGGQVVAAADQAGANAAAAAAPVIEQASAFAGAVVAGLNA
ncbi:hypothetical protein [Rhodococcus oxybenzonivorans]|uniref:hypothetical protein n=1 Tax=Rhodococcus oxybenzonivorans TaxID=1990687 RepID=UPI001951D86F|nr:hypothetical protein [Rhodococcus oxybenzonivorans]